MNDPAIPRKRIATYGKLFRKRTQHHLPPETVFGAPSSSQDKDSIPASAEHEVPSAQQPAPTHIKSPKISPAAVSSNIYDFPSDEDSQPTVTPKKRKLGDASTKPKLKSVQKKMPGVVGDGVHKTANSSLPKDGTSHNLLGDKSTTITQRLPNVLKTHREDGAQTSPTMTQSLKPMVKPALVSSNTNAPSSPSLTKKATQRRASAIKPSATESASKQRLTTPPKQRASPTTARSTVPITPPPQSPSGARKPLSSGKRSTPGVLTPHRREIWEQLLGVDAVEGETHSTHTDQQTYPKQDSSSQSRTKPPRRRLIDSLVEQSSGVRPAMFSSILEEDETEEDQIEESITESVVGEAPDSQTKALDLAFDSMPKVIPKSNTSSSQVVGTKVTYSRQRSMLAEQAVSDKMAFDVPLADSQPTSLSQRRGSIPILVPLATFHELDEDEDSQAGAGIRTLHELRQAGANSRFADEIGDLLDQIGTPGVASRLSLRRSGLLELASKVQEKDFYIQFITLSMDQKLFIHLGKETDVVCGFLITSILLRVLENGITELTVTQLRRQGITRLLIRLLDVDASILSLAKDRKTNMSKLAQAMLAEHHNLMLRSKGWADIHPTSLSPRTAALRCLEAMVKQIREAGNSNDIISKELTTKLFHLVDLPADQTNAVVLDHLRSANFQLTLSTLESHSLRAMTGSDESLWIGDFLPIIREILKTSLNYSAEDCGVLQSLALRLTLNVTNNNSSASNVFAKADLLRILGRVIIEKFGGLASFQQEEERVILVDQLVLMLGVAINFAEWSEQARTCFDTSEGLTGHLIGAFVQIFVDNLDRMSEVSQSNI